MTTIAHISDLHFGRTVPDVVAALTQDIRTLKPDLVAVSGDLTQGGRNSEFREARSFLDGLGCEVLATPGNHDITPYRLVERFLDPYGRWRSHIAPEIEPTWMNEDAAVFALNSARPAGWHWDWSRGRISRRQLHHLALRAAEAGPRLRIVMVHHPMLTPADAPNATPVGRANLALKHLRESGIDLVLSGHLHHSGLLGESRTRIIPKGGPIVLLSGTATSSRLRREMNSYHVIRMDGAELTVEQRLSHGNAWVSAQTQVLRSPANMTAS